MGMAEEIAKLKELHESGALTDAEFADAKRKVLQQSSDGGFAASARRRRTGGVFDELESDDQSLGRAANRYVSFQIVMAVVGIIVFLIIASQMVGNFNSGPRFGP